MVVLRQRVKYCTCYTQSRVIVIRKQFPAVMLNELHFYIYIHEAIIEKQNKCQIKKLINKLTFSEEKYIISTQLQMYNIFILFKK